MLNRTYIYSILHCCQMLFLIPIRCLSHSDYVVTDLSIDFRLSSTSNSSTFGLVRGQSWNIYQIVIKRSKKKERRQILLCHFLWVLNGIELNNDKLNGILSWLHFAAVSFDHPINFRIKSTLFSDLPKYYIKC